MIKRLKLLSIFNYHKCDYTPPDPALLGDKNYKNY